MIDEILPVTALILSIVNGAILFYDFVRDRPKLIVGSVHPETYQFWFRLEDIEKENTIFRRYGFISYFSVCNKGLRDVSVNGWRLHIRNKLFFRKPWKTFRELVPYNLPEAQTPIGESHVKLIRIFGQNSQSFENNSNMIKSGDSISGLGFWVYSVYGGDGWSPKTDNHNNISAVLKVANVFGNKSRCKMTFRETNTIFIKKIFPDIGKYLEDNNDFLI